MFKWIDDHLEDWLLVFLLSAMSLLIGFQVFMRYVMGDSLTWSEELARYMFIWATYIGAAYGVKAKAHVSITFVTERLPENIRHISNIFAYLLFLAFAFLVVKDGFVLIAKIFKLGQVSSSLGIPMGWVYLGPVTGFTLICWRLLQAIFSEIQLVIKGA